MANQSMASIRAEIEKSARVVGAQQPRLIESSDRPRLRDIMNKAVQHPIQRIRPILQDEP